jgi:NitT/TauT family transport system ATP-binding protein
LFDADGTKRMQSQYPLLSMEAVRIGYGSHDKTNPAVEDVSFEVWAGEKVVLLGPSGCGKSTLLKAIAGFIRPDGGVISFAGREDLRPGPGRSLPGVRPALPLAHRDGQRRVSTSCHGLGQG